MPPVVPSEVLRPAIDDLLVGIGTNLNATQQYGMRQNQSNSAILTPANPGTGPSAIPAYRRPTPRAAPPGTPPGPLGTPAGGSERYVTSNTRGYRGWRYPAPPGPNPEGVVTPDQQDILDQLAPANLDPATPIPDVLAVVDVDNTALRGLYRASVLIRRWANEARIRRNTDFIERTGNESLSSARVALNYERKAKRKFFERDPVTGQVVRAPLSTLPTEMVPTSLTDPTPRPNPTVQGTGAFTSGHWGESDHPLIVTPRTSERARRDAQRLGYHFGRRERLFTKLSNIEAYGPTPRRFRPNITRADIEARILRRNERINRVAEEPLVALGRQQEQRQRLLARRQAYNDAL